MNFKSTLWTIGVILLLIAAAWVLFTKIIPTFFALAVGLIPFVLMIAGIVSCINSNKSKNIKILWILICIFAPIIGPLIWFLWGKQNT